MSQQTMYPGMVNSPITEIAQSITDTDTTFEVVDGDALPAAPNLAVIGVGEAAETVLYVNKTGNTLSNVTRGFQGVAKAWVAGTKIARRFTDYDHGAFIANIEDHESRLSDVEDELSNMELSADKITLDNPNFSSDNVNDGMSELFTNVNNGKNAIAAAIVDMGQSATGGNTFSQLAAKIRDISKDATASVGDVDAGKTFYQGGVKRTGTKPQHTGHVNAQSISRSGTTLRFRPPAGNYPGDSGNSVQWNDPNWIADNIREGTSIFGLTGTLVEGKEFVTGQTTVGSNGKITVTGLPFTPSIIILRVLGNQSDVRHWCTIYVDGATLWGSSDTNFNAGSNSSGGTTPSFESVTSNAFTMGSSGTVHAGKTAYWIAIK